MENEALSKNFIEQIIDKDIESGHCKKVITRFPPEPNGYLHIGHAKSILLNYGLAKEYGGQFNMRFDDTNPTKEKVEFVDSIKADVEWLGAEWNGDVLFASDYFPQMYEAAVKLIKKGKAYVDDLSAEEIRKYRGTLTEPGKESPYRNRSVEENLQLFEEMKEGKYADGTKVLRAKIDMASPNINMRDPVIYRVAHMTHHRTGDQWCIYPMYDFAHGQSDYFEGVTHSICTLEFEVHRPLYDWFVDQLADETYRPRQMEFNRLNLTYTVMSKRKLLQLVQEKLVSGWDDPRMPTICGLRRRGYTPRSIRNFIDRIGYTKYDGLISVSLLEHSIREDLNKTANRVSAVLNPVKLIITNYPENQVEYMKAENNPEDESAGFHEIPFTRELYIERDDFMENPPKKFFRMTPGQEVRLKSAYIVKCTGCKKGENGEIEEIYCEYDPLTKSGMPESGRKVKGTLHWVSVEYSKSAEIRLYDRLFCVENPSEEKEKDFRELLNPESLKILNNCRIEPYLFENAKPGDRFQFQRTGYFCVDKDSKPDKLVFNRTVSLKDSWEKIKGK